jgi:hypothetical protein
MDTDAPDAQSSAEEVAAPKKSARPPPIVLTSAANLIRLQKLKGVARQNFELRNTRTGTRVVTKDMVDYQAVKAHFTENSLAYFTFSLNLRNP